MPRPILGQKQAAGQSQLSLSDQREQTRFHGTLSKQQRERLLNKPRSRAYLDALAKLDLGLHNQKMGEEVIEQLHNEFEEIVIEDELLGLVSRCYLGEPYEVHTLDMAGNIITHYQSGEPLPPSLEKARSIAKYGNYVVIEVYRDCCRAIDKDGNVSFISG